MMEEPKMAIEQCCGHRRIIDKYLAPLTPCLFIPPSSALSSIPSNISYSTPEWYVYSPTQYYFRVISCLSRLHLLPASHQIQKTWLLPRRKASGVQASSECIEAFSDLKLSHKYKYIVYSLGEGNKEIVISHKEAQSAGKTNKEYFDDLVSKFPADDCRYSVFDFEYEKTDGSG